VSEEAAKDRSWWREALAFWPLGLAVAATSVFGWYTFKLAQEVATVGGVTASRYQHFLAGRPNEMGDTLAGFVGSLTLIWVVASVLQQSMELRAQRREFSEMVRAQDSQVRALEAQISIFQDEKRRRDQSEARELYEQYLIDVCRMIQFLRDRDLKWYFPDPRDTDYDLYGKVIWLFPGNGRKVEGEESVNAFHRSLLLQISELRQHLRKNSNVRRPMPTAVVSKLAEKLERICALQSSLASPEVEKINRMTAKRLSEVLREVEKDDSLWASPEETVTQ
jgi:hypothetical protein